MMALGLMLGWLAISVQELRVLYMCSSCSSSTSSLANAHVPCKHNFPPHVVPTLNIVFCHRHRCNEQATRLHPAAALGTITQASCCFSILSTAFFFISRGRVHKQQRLPVVPCSPCFLVYRCLSFFCLSAPPVASPDLNFMISNFLP